MIEALTLTPPWDFAIIHCGKSIENRKWKTTKRGWVLIHAAQQTSPEDHAAVIETAQAAGYTGPMPEYREVRRSAITGAVRIVNVMHYDEQARCKMPLGWSVPAQFGFVLADPIALPPVHAKGAQGFWKVPRDVREKLLAECERTGTPLPAELRKMLGEGGEGEPVRKQQGFDF